MNCRRDASGAGSTARCGLLHAALRLQDGGARGADHLHAQDAPRRRHWVHGRGRPAHTRRAPGQCDSASGRSLECRGGEGVKKKLVWIVLIGLLVGSAVYEFALKPPVEPNPREGRGGGEG